MSSDKFMSRAIELSQIKMNEGCGGPFGAVIVKDGEIVGEGWNKVTSSNDPTAHAEVSAIREACEKLGDFELKNCSIYTSCEPCPMCLAAIYWARIDKIYYANDRKDAASINFDDDHIYQEIPKDINDRAIPMSQISRDEAFEVFKEWTAKDDKVLY